MKKLKTFRSANNNSSLLLDEETGFAALLALDGLHEGMQFPSRDEKIKNVKYVEELSKAYKLLEGLKERCFDDSGRTTLGSHIDSYYRELFDYLSDEL